MYDHIHGDKKINGITLDENKLPTVVVLKDENRKFTYFDVIYCLFK